MNQRQHDRYPTDFMVRVEVLDGMTPREARCVNLSVGGMFIAMDPPLPRATRVKLQIRLKPVDKTIFTEGLVVWTRPRMPDPQFPPGMGVKFDELDDETRELIQQAIAKLSEDRDPI